MSRSERMSSIDTSWLRMDKPANLMMITGVIMLEVRSTMRRWSVVSPRACSPSPFPAKGSDVSDRSVLGRGPGLRYFPPYPAGAPAGKGGKLALQRYVAELAASPLNASHPLWQYTIVEDYEGGAAVISRFHHAIADGMALIGCCCR